MKILHILDHSIPLHSGYTFRTRAILEQQRKLGWETFHVTSAKHVLDCLQKELIDGLEFFRSPSLQSFWAKWPILDQYGIVVSLARRLIEIIPEIQPDILHAHSPALNGLAALRAAKKFNLPLVYECRAFWEDAAVDHGTTTENSLRYFITRALETYIFKKADKITTICQGLRDDIIKRGIPPEKITVIPNAVDAEKFIYNIPPNLALKQHLNLDKQIVLGFIGSFYAYEGLLLLLDAMPKLLAQHSNIRLLLVGGGPQEAAIKQKIKDLNLGQAVILTGRVDNNLVQQYYSLVDIFVYPRLPMRLTDLVTPLKPLEAMAQGRLVLASDVGGHKELIEHQKNGYLFKANDVEDLAAKVGSLINSTELWQTLRENGRHFVEQSRTWVNSVSRYKGVYSDIVKQPPLSGQLVNTSRINP